MTLLEAISPMARVLLAAEKSVNQARKKSGGGIVNITKNARRGKFRVHVEIDGRPACGGGCGARSAEWQQVMIQPDCQACAKILKLVNHTTKASHETHPIN